MLFYFEGIGQTWNPAKSRTPEGPQLVRELRSKIMQLTASAVPPTLTRDLQARIESQKV